MNCTQQDSTCTTRLRIWTPEDEDNRPKDGDCILEQYGDGFWWQCGRFGFMELAIQRAKDTSVLLFGRGVKNRDQYRLVCEESNQPFTYFDVYEGVMYPGTGPIFDARSKGKLHASSTTTV